MLEMLNSRLLETAYTVKVEKFTVVLGFQAQKREGERVNSENVSALSDGAYTTSWLLMVT
jgi:hypothetical protein